MKCIKCYQDLHDDDSFCQNCGTPVRKRFSCEKCNSDYYEGDNYCSRCGGLLHIEDEISNYKSMYAPNGNTSFNSANNSNPFSVLVGIMAVIVLVIIGVATIGSNDSLSNNINTSINNNKKIKMPDIIGVSEQQALEQLWNLDLNNYSFIYEEANGYPEGIVLRTEPVKGTSIKKDANVTVYISADSMVYEDYFDSGSYLYQIQISDSVGKINVRSTPNEVNGTIIGSAYPNEVYSVYETKNTSKYTWYRIGNNAWIASNGTWIQEVYDLSPLSNNYTFTIQIIDESIGVYNKPRADREKLYDIGYGSVCTVYNSFYDGSHTWYEIDKGKWIKEANGSYRVNRLN